ncbi:MAG: glycosyltransferase [Bacteroidales bacterium]|nr:glycosyltransferase [Bacteroidales bacterium]
MDNSKISIVIPLYNRPDEIDELLDSLEKQTSNNFDVIVVEDGSDKPSKDIVEKYSNKLDVKYFFKQNSGPGLTRNYGAERSDGDYIVFFDSDCIIPPDYVKIVTESLKTEYVDAYGGPDAALPTFTPVQKAISYAMTSILSTGGIRGASEKAGKFHPRSFNMGFSRKVFENTSGFSNMRFGEDIDMTLRILEQGFTTKLIKDAFVYHKRRTDFRKFFKQIFNSGCARINLKLRHKGSLKLIHTFPSLFLLGNVFCILAALVTALIFKNIIAPLICVAPLVLFALIVLVDSTRQNGFKVGLLSVIAVYVQLTAYGLGFLKAVWHGLIRKKGDTFGFVRNFYK